MLVTYMEFLPTSSKFRSAYKFHCFGTFQSTVLGPRCGHDDEREIGHYHRIIA